MEENKGEQQRTVTFETHTAAEAAKFLHGIDPMSHEQPSGPAPSGPSGPGADIHTGPAVEDWKVKHDALLQELTDLKSKESSLTGFKNPLFYKLAKIEEESPEEAPIYQRIAFGNPDPVELWKIGFVRDHPQYKDHPEDVQLFLETTHPLIFDETVSKDSKEYKVAKMKFDLEVEGIKGSFKSRLDKIVPPDPNTIRQTEKANNTALATSWQPEFVPIAQGLKKLTVEATLEDNSKVPFEIEMTPEDQKKYLEKAALYVLVNKLPNSPENSQKVRDYIESAYFADNHKKILAAIVKQAYQNRDKANVRFVLNSASPASKTTPPGKTVNSQEDFVAAVTRKKKQ
jgi:hypothetical protein